MTDLDVSALPEHVSVNRDHWNGNPANWVELGERAWSADEMSWGMWSIPEGEVQILPESLDGLDTIELGCGTGYISSWLAKRGASAVGI